MKTIVEDRDAPTIPTVANLTALARSAGVRRQTLLLAAQQGRLPIVRLGRLTYSTPQAVAELLTPRVLVTAT